MCIGEVNMKGHNINVAQLVAEDLVVTDEVFLHYSWRLLKLDKMHQNILVADEIGENNMQIQCTKSST